MLWLLCCLIFCLCQHIADLEVLQFYMIMKFGIQY